MADVFGANSTADEVLAGVDLRGQRVLLTGASAGIGHETARALVARGAAVVGTSRAPESSHAAIEVIEAAAALGGSFKMVRLDLASLASVRRCADDLLRVAAGFDVVLGNAGLMIGPKALTEDGIEAQFATNFLGHFLLINRIANLIKTSGRIALVSSAGHRRSDVDLQDPNFTHTPYDEYLAYGRSKTAVILLAVELDRRLRAKASEPQHCILAQSRLKLYRTSSTLLEMEKKRCLRPSNGKPFPRGQLQPSGQESSREPPKLRRATAKIAMLLTSWTMLNCRPAFVPTP